LDTARTVSADSWSTSAQRQPPRKCGRPSRTAVRTTIAAAAGCRTCPTPRAFPNRTTLPSPSMNCNEPFST